MLLRREGLREMLCVWEDMLASLSSHTGSCVVCVRAVWCDRMRGRSGRSDNYRAYQVVKFDPRLGGARASCAARVGRSGGRNNLFAR